MGAAVLALYLLDDLLNRRHTGAVAGKNFLPQRHAIADHNEANAYLLTVMTMITAMAALGEWVSLGISREVATT